MNKEIMITVPLERYENGVCALARIEALKVMTFKSKYIIDKEYVAAILGFELSQEDSGCRQEA